MPEQPLEWVIILKFSGYEFLNSWMASEERALWIQNARNEQLFVQDSLDGHFDDGLELQQGSIAFLRIESPKPRQSQSIRAPPKWKVACVLELAVFPTVTLHALAGTAETLKRAFDGNHPFMLLVSTSMIVPLITFAFAPVLMSVFGPWVQRARPARLPEPFRTLDEGFDLFTPPPPVDWGANPLSIRVEHLEGKLDDVKGVLRDQSRIISAMQDVLETHGLDATGAKMSKQERSERQVRQEIVSTAFLEEFEQAELDEESGNTRTQEEESGVDFGVSVVIHHRIKWAYSAHFEDWVREINEKAAVVCEGFLGANVLHTPETMEYVVILRFESYKDLRKWMNSNERQDMLQRLEPFLEPASIKSTYKVVAGDGSDTEIINHIMPVDVFASLFLRTGECLPKRQAPVWKTCFLTWIGLFLMLWIVDWHVPDMLIPQDLPPLVNIFVLTCMTVTLTTYIGIPLTTLLFGHWLHMVPTRDTGQKQRENTKAGTLSEILVFGLPSWYHQLALLLAYYVVGGAIIYWEQGFAVLDTMYAMVH
ncbi:hypothetical protein CYMTET_41702 [Cymbomonas tetramitiformis]|uniref:ABM domain-containing protein n=1 Tax=Cymbomonas tetramitiformis TaxID=36881 RepID=A0AAE0C5L1_9CHLO|nr:hypothetical protein CYMTET_41702 [Cymbomonas tetramitiformis]|eukprot:gene19783-23660_t